jgi:predicted regulator of Ras-like GTPase activity (Roadblock/LC7/MglB family)/tetratricopeptide (TPR) repeat protein
MALFGGPTIPVSRLEELKRLLQKDPTSRQFLALAEEYRRHGKYRDAVITLERGLQLHATSVAAHVALGKTYQQLDRLEDAIRAFTGALRIDRENLVAIRQLAEVYLARGDKVEAIKKLKLYRGLKAGDRDVNEIIQRLEEEMSAAVAERPRSGVHPAVPEPPEAPRPSPYSSGVRRVALIPRLDRSPVPPQTKPVLPREPADDLFSMTYDGVTLSRGVKAARSGPVVPPPPPYVPRPVEDLLVETSPAAVSAPVPEAAPEPAEIAPRAPRTETAPDSAPAPSSSTAPIAAVREESAVERDPFALDEPPGEPDVPEEAATAPFTFPVDLYRTVARARSSAETAPFDIPDAPPDEPPSGTAAPPAPAAEAVPLVTETLGDLYRAQGHLAEARETYRTLAESAADEDRAHVLREKADALPRGARADHPRLRRFARRFPRLTEATVDDLQALISSLVERTAGVRAATLTDLEGLPVVMAGASSRDAAMETLVAELSSFQKNVRRTTAETGTGELESFAVAGPHGGAVVSRVSTDYSLILEVDPDAAFGEIRWEAARTARALRPAVR